MNGILSGKVALITGAGSGIAAAAARLFHNQGASIVLADVSGKEAELAAELGERAVACRADVSKSDDVKAMIDIAISEFGQLDILCNVAGITGPQGSLEDAHEEDFDRVIAVNIAACSSLPSTRFHISSAGMAESSLISRPRQRSLECRALPSIQRRRGRSLPQPASSPLNMRARAFARM